MLHASNDADSRVLCALKNKHGDRKSHGILLKCKISVDGYKDVELAGRERQQLLSS